jgi:hypothetical protein
VEPAPEAREEICELCEWFEITDAEVVLAERRGCILLRDPRMGAFQDARTGNAFSRSAVPKLTRTAAEDRIPGILDLCGKDTPAGSCRAMLDTQRLHCGF